MTIPAATVPGGKCRIEIEGLLFEVDPRVGGRIVTFALDGENILIGPDVDPLNYGSTFWTSPQSQWSWPPVVEIDSAPYGASLERGTIALCGAASERLGVSVGKRFTGNRARRSISAEYGIRNHRATAVTLAPWEITRVPPGGLTFFESGQAIYPPSTLAVEQSMGVTWFRYDQSRITDHQKVFSDSSGGWIAHVDLARSLVLVKTFPEIPRAQQAPGEAEIEIYANPAHTYVEVEQQGVYGAIPPGEARSWTVEWYLARLPPSIEPAVGAKDLVRFVKDLIR
jgi:hypothetical protein